MPVLENLRALRRLVGCLILAGLASLVFAPTALSHSAFVGSLPVSTEDGHALEGSFSFGLRAAATGAESVVSKSHLTSTRYTEFDRPIRTVAPDVN